MFNILGTRKYGRSSNLPRCKTEIQLLLMKVLFLNDDTYLVS